MTESKLFLIIVETELEAEVFSILEDYSASIKSSLKPRFLIFPTRWAKLDGFDKKTNSLLDINASINMLSTAISKSISKEHVYRKIGLEDIEKVLLITNMNGSFINDNRIMPDSNQGKTFFGDDCIYTDSPETIIEKNHNKQKILNDFLSSPQIIKLQLGKKEKIFTLEIFYMSCNLPHIVLKDRNASLRKKEKELFIWKNNMTSKEESQTIRCFFSALLPTENDYKKTWNYITTPEANNTLHRCSNCAFMLDLIDEYTKGC